jgi:uncharacterized protein YjiS (DUF1127 family)
MRSKRAPVPYRAGRAGVAGRVQRFICVLELALDVRRERQALLSLDDATLKDMGLSRADAWAEARRPLWEIPRDRLGCERSGGATRRSPTLSSGSPARRMGARDRAPT